MPCTATVTLRLELVDRGNRSAEEYRQHLETEVLRHLVMLRGWLEGRRIYFANPHPSLRIEIEEAGQEAANEGG
ncbi:MAG: hypothetical protein HYY96_14700 [Candidatus Tectomicrobia bacterium]|nr:hypothetical protein [Candidatus Tectomicrobia bacterium]